jgi:hypothetical protein
MAFPFSVSYSTNESVTLPLARLNPILTEVMPFNPVALPSESDLTLLNKLTLSDEDGKTVVVGDLLKDSTVILVAIRHFRCGFCSVSRCPAPILNELIDSNVLIANRILSPIFHLE